MLIKGNFIFAKALDDLVVKEDNYLLIQDGKVVEFFSEFPKEYRNEKVIDYSGKLIIPSFTDLHVHAPQFKNTGIGYETELLNWLAKYTFPTESAFKDPNVAEKLYKLFLKSFWQNGILSFSAFGTIHKESTYKLMELAEQTGMQTYIGKVNMDRNTSDTLKEDIKKSLEDTEELINRAKDFTNSKFIITPRFVISTTKEIMLGLGELAEKYDLPIQSHLCENRFETDFVRQLHPDIKNYLRVYEDFGLIRKGKTIMAHCIYCDEDEIGLLKEKEIHVAHCPQSNFALNSGIMPLRKYLDLNIHCSIATDLSGGYSSNMCDHIVTTVNASRALSMLTAEKYKPLSLYEAFYLATKASGIAFNKFNKENGKSGSFEKGYNFNALVVDDTEISKIANYSPLERLQHFIYTGTANEICARYCKGKLLELDW